jgi:hypothetical protein
MDILPRHGGLLRHRYLAVAALAILFCAACAQRLQPPQPERRAYVARTPDARGFIGYVAALPNEESVLEQGGPWPNVDDALAWARSRASEVLLTFGFDSSSRFSAGSRYWDGGDPANPVAVWPPTPAEHQRVEAEVRRVAAATKSDESPTGTIMVIEHERRVK